jgi:hypothetical protein
MDPKQYLSGWLVKFANQHLAEDVTAAVPPEALSSCKICYPLWPARAWHAARTTPCVDTGLLLANCLLTVPSDSLKIV